MIVTSLKGGASNDFAPGDIYRISRFSGVVDAGEGLVPFHAVEEPFKTSYVADWNLQDTNGILVSVSDGVSEYHTALEHFVESTTWSGSVPVTIDNGICVWTPDTAAGVSCTGYFGMSFFAGVATKTDPNELEDSTLHFDEWGVVSGAKIENVTDGSWGIAGQVNDNTLVLEAGLAGGTNNYFSTGDVYRVTMPAGSTEIATMDLVQSPFLIDFEADYLALGIEAGDTIYNDTQDDWGVVTGVNSTGLTASDVTFNAGDSYIVRYDFIRTREYELTFDYKGLVDERGVNGVKRRDVCSNDGSAETSGVPCMLSGVMNSAELLSMTDDTVAGFVAAGVKVGDMVVNLSDEGSRGIVRVISGNSLSVASLNGGTTNQFTSGDRYAIHLIENLNDDTIFDDTNDDLATVTIIDRDGSGNVVGSASAEVPLNSPALASIYVRNIYADLEVQLDALDTSYDLPLWFTENKWHRLMYVAASSEVLPGASGVCNAGANCLTVDGLIPNDDKEVLVIAAGPALPVQDRLLGTICGAFEPAFFCDYYEGENADFDFDEPGPPPPTFEHTPVGDTFNDQVKVLRP